LDRGYTWQDELQHTTGKETLQINEIPDNIKGVTDKLVDEVLKCNECDRNYRVVLAELQLYKRFNLPIPRNCPQCRFAKRRQVRLPYKLWHRKCMCDYKTFNNTTKHPHHETGQCPNEFETSYSPDRKEIVYCEQCYQAEVV